MLWRDVVEYLSALRIAQGPRAGERFSVMPWQRRFIRGALAPGAYESVLTMARGGGKTTTIAALGCAMLDEDGPLAERNSTTAVVAASLPQARICMEHVGHFLGERVQDRNAFRVWNTVNRSAIHNKRNGVTLELKSCNPGGLHGLAGSVICDELAQWPANKIRPALSALETGLGKVEGSRIWKIGTRAASSGHPFEEAIRDADFAQVHAARPDDPPFQKRTWARACPSLPFMPHLLARIRSEAAKAKRNPGAHLAAFRALRLNLGVSDVREAVLVELDAWRRAEGDVEPSGAPVWGVDLGGTAASSAVSAYWPQSGRLDVLAAFPSEGLTLGERGLRDGVGSLYREQAARRELILTPGFATDVSFLLREALERFGKPSSIATDRYRQGELFDGLTAAGVPPAAVTLRGMGYIDGGDDVRRFQRAMLEGKVRPVVSLVLRSGMAEARIVGPDAAGNWKLAKGSEGGRRLRARDDAVAAALLAVGEGSRQLPRLAARRKRRWAKAAPG